LDPDEIHYYVTEDPPLGWTVPPEQNLDTSPEDFDDVIEEIQRLEAEEGETIYDEKYAKELELEDDLEDLRDQETSYEYPEY